MLGVDTDPVNSTFSGYKELNIQPLNIMDGDDIDQRRFDSLMEIIFQQPRTATSSSTTAQPFVPLCSYLKKITHSISRRCQPLNPTAHSAHWWSSHCGHRKRFKNTGCIFPNRSAGHFGSTDISAISSQMVSPSKSSKSTRNTAANSTRSSKFRTVNTPLSART